MKSVVFGSEFVGNLERIGCDRRQAYAGNEERLTENELEKTSVLNV